MKNADVADRRITPGIQRALIGALGGFAVFAAYLGHNHATFALAWGDLLLLPFLVTLGAGAAWMSRERHRMKLFALSISAPAMAALLAAPLHLPEMADRVVGVLLPAAYAQGAPLATIPALEDTNHQYFIYVGAFRDPDTKYRLLARINFPTHGLYAFTTDTVDRNGVRHDRVFVASKFTPAEAQAARQRLLRSGVVQEAEFWGDIEQR